MTDFDASDIAAMRREGDLRSFLRDQLRAGRTKTTAPPAPPPKPPGHRPGHWPTGTRPPDPRPTRHTAADWQQELDRYRTGHGHDNDPCHCGTC
ncbi:hypothetical protein AB0M89_13330 [Streptomyces microflavus]|uniref:hypothetical protein n=1 Tax=Streptomyces microflavus TaxID=1919 RepID=UPI0034486B2B